ncbi:MAG: CBS domain-containing protein [Bacillota bacterium]|nr:CBS domain-containing protein [Bacillota bacterium]
MKAGELMSRNVITAGTGTTIEEIAHLLSDNNISGLPVVDKDGRLVGIVTQKDVLYKDIEPRFPPIVQLLGGNIFLKGVKHYNEELKKLIATKAEDIMTKDVVTVEEETEVEKVAELMVENGVNRIPVTKDKKLTGIIGRADIVRYLAGTLE